MKKIIQYAALWISLSFLFTQCDSLLATDIQKILDNPEAYAEKEVTIHGTVGNVTDLAIIRYYKLTDNTGEIHVIAKNELPTRGETKTVMGTVNPVFKIGNLQVTVLEESPKRSK